MANRKKIEIYDCPLFNCERHFDSLDVLKKHVLYHAGVSPFMCHYCGTAFKIEHCLTNHLALKHGETAKDKFKTLKGYVSCNICLAMIPIREKRNHILIHIPSEIVVD